MVQQGELLATVSCSSLFLLVSGLWGCAETLGRVGRGEAGKPGVGAWGPELCLLFDGSSKQRQDGEGRGEGKRGRRCSVQLLTWNGDGAAECNLRGGGSSLGTR